MAGPNARLSRRLLEAMGLWDQALATGAVFINPYDATNIADARRNLADSLSLGFIYTSRLADCWNPSSPAAPRRSGNASSPQMAPRAALS